MTLKGEEGEKEGRLNRSILGYSEVLKRIWQGGICQGVFEPNSPVGRFFGLPQLDLSSYPCLPCCVGTVSGGEPGSWGAGQLVPCG